MKRFYDALLRYVPEKYFGNVVAYEAKTKPLYRLPQVGRIWRMLAPQSEIVDVDGTHLSILREPRVNALAEDLCKRLAKFFSEGSTEATCPETVPLAPSTGSAKTIEL